MRRRLSCTLFCIRAGLRFLLPGTSRGTVVAVLLCDSEGVAAEVRGNADAAHVAAALISLAHNVDPTLIANVAVVQHTVIPPISLN